MTANPSKTVRWADRVDMEHRNSKRHRDSEKMEGEDLLPLWRKPQPLPAPPDEAITDHPQKRRRWNIIFLPIISLAAVLLGFVLGRATRLPWVNNREDEVTRILELPADVQRTMRYNQTFSLPPSEETDRAWDDLFPPYKGFIQIPFATTHKGDSSDRPHHTVGVAVYHELHCLSILRIGFYAALNGTLVLSSPHPSSSASALSDADADAPTAESTPFILLDSTIHDHNKRPDPHHIRHCFDYLRQSLMCLADGNLETVDQGLGGVTGWGQRKCRDWAGVERMARERGGWGL